MSKEEAQEAETQDVNDNMALWSLVEETDPKHTKSVSFGGRKFSTIDAYYQIKTATSLWGSYGHRWGLNEIEYHRIADTPMYRVSARFYYPAGRTPVSFPINTAIKFTTNNGKFDDDFAKKVETDLITKSLSRLGFNADVFLGMFDDNKYVEELTEKYTPTYSDVQKQSFDELIEKDDVMGMALLSLTVDTKVFTDLYNSFPKGQKVKMKQHVDAMIKKGHQLIDRYELDIAEALEQQDGFWLTELLADLGNDGKVIIWNRLNDEQKQIAKEILAQVEQ